MASIDRVGSHVQVRNIDMMVPPAENPLSGFGIDIEPKQGQSSKHSN
jgi:hypothetical protein